MVAKQITQPKKLHFNQDSLVNEPFGTINLNNVFTHNVSKYFLVEIRMGVYGVSFPQFIHTCS